MDYLNGMNDAIDYIESNLDGEINYDRVANLAGCSINCFQRIFSYIANVNLSEYIRHRRMTLAAFELQNSAIKVIDLAIKYGYESPDSFSRAFQNIHGITPLMARNSGISLKAYPRITFHISIKGDVEMNYRIEKKEAFRIVGIKRKFQGPEDDESVVPKFWNEVFENGTYEELLALSNGNPKGVHGFIQVFGEEKVDYTIACMTDKEPPKGMESFIIPESIWAIFQVEGSVGTVMAEAWRRIFSEWLPTSNYKYAESVDIECFPYQGNRGASDFKFEIWLPIEKK
ncbi:MAG: effector binding domain-containing protein [Cellulosilyticaceae bacterium]